MRKRHAASSVARITVGDVTAEEDDRDRRPFLSGGVPEGRLKPMWMRWAPGLGRQVRRQFESHSKNTRLCHSSAYYLGLYCWKPGAALKAALFSSMLGILVRPHSRSSERRAAAPPQTSANWAAIRSSGCQFYKTETRDAPITGNGGSRDGIAGCINRPAACLWGTSKINRFR